MMLKRYLSYLFVLLALAACQKEPLQEMSFQGESLILFYTCGHNNGLSANIENNLSEILDGPLPSIESSQEVVLFLKHSNNSAPQLLRLGASQGGKNISREIRLDEMLDWDKQSVSISSDTLAHVLRYISRQYTARHNYLIFSSHGTGWLPIGVYDADPQTYTYIENTFGIDWQDGNILYEMGIRQMTGKLPMHFDVILFDACLMGGVEVAYELKDKCRYVGFSPTEILSHGMYYQSMCSHLLSGEVVAIGEDYMNYYRNIYKGSHSATYAIVDCNKLDGLADVCKDIFTGHRAEMETIQPAKIQRYFRGDHPWFYDLRDIAVNLQADDSQLAALDKALEDVVIFHDETETFLGELKLERCCGLSMYLPASGSLALNEYYRTYKWNIATAYLPAE